MFREIEKKDLEGLIEIYIEAFNREPWNDNWTIETAAKRLENMMNDSGFYGITLVEEEIIYGFILGHEEQFYDGVIFNIKEFCTNSKKQGNGYGEKLLLELEKRLHGKGIKEIILMTTRDDKAEGFYKRRGYKSHSNLVMMGKN